jgi:hypothetical protein
MASFGKETKEQEQGDSICDEAKEGGSFHAESPIHAYSMRRRRILIG